MGDGESWSALALAPFGRRCRSPLDLLLPPLWAVVHPASSYLGNSQEQPQGWLKNGQPKQASASSAYGPAGLHETTPGSPSGSITRAAYHPGIGKPWEGAPYFIGQMWGFITTGSGTPDRPSRTLGIALTTGETPFAQQCLP